MSIGIIGASGVVGFELVELLLKNGYTKFKLCASDASIGKIFWSYIFKKDIDPILSETELHYDTEHSRDCHIFHKLDKSFFEGLTVAFFCTDNDVSREWVPIAKKHCVFVIDSSSEFRMNPDFHLIIPEINGDLVKESQIVCSPNCCASILAMVLHPLMETNHIVRIDVSTYQAVSGAGKLGPIELKMQSEQFANDDSITNNTGIFKSQIFNNCFSHNSSIDDKNGYNGEELKIINETKKILDCDIDISATCIRVPIVRAHSMTVKIVFKNKSSEEDIRSILTVSPGIVVIDDRKNNVFPEPKIATMKNDIFVGRIRRDYSDKSDTVFHMFICGDQLLKGASLNAFQIFKCFEKYNSLIY